MENFKGNDLSERGAIIMIFSKAKKRDFTDPAALTELAEELEKSFDSIQNVLQNVQTEKSNFQSLLSSVETERNGILSAVKSIQEIQSGLRTMTVDYESLKKKTELSQEYESRMDDYAKRSEDMEKRFNKIENSLNKVLANENFVNALSDKISAVVDGVGKSKDSKVLQDAVKAIVSIEERQQLMFETIKKSEKQADIFTLL